MDTIKVRVCKQQFKMLFLNVPIGGADAFFTLAPVEYSEMINNYYREVEILTPFPQ